MTSGGFPAHPHPLSIGINGIAVTMGTGYNSRVGGGAGGVRARSWYRPKVKGVKLWRVAPLKEYNFEFDICR